MPDPTKPSAPSCLLRRGLIFLALALTALWIARPLWLARAELSDGSTRWVTHNMMFDNHEKLHFVIRLVDLDDALRQGQWPVRWCPNFNGGYGYPFFNFYAPLGYYLAETWVLAGLDVYNAWKLTFVLLRLVAGLLMFGFARQFFRWPAALVTALMFQLAPYHLANLYVRGNIAELTAMSLYPGVLWAWTAAARRATRPNLLIAAASLALLILSHNITALFGTMFLCALLLAMWAHRGRSFPALRLFGAGLAGVGLSAFFWMPAILEMRFVQAGGLNATFNETADHLVYWRQFFQNRWGFGLSAPGFEDGMPFTLGLAHWLGVAGALIMLAILRFRPQDDKSLRPAILFGSGWLAALLITMTLMTPLGGAFWRLPGMGTIQFPWRALLLATVAITLLAGWSIELAGQFEPRLARIWTPLLLLVLLFVSAPKISVGGYFVNRPPQLYTAEGTRAQPHWVNTNIGEFLPVWVNPSAYPEDRRLSQYALRTEDQAPLKIIPPAHALDARFRLELSGPGPLTYDVFFFPGWQITIDGQTVQTRPSPAHGLMQFDAPAGSHEFHIWLGYSPIRQLGTAISILTLLVCAGLTLSTFRRPKPPAPANQSDPGSLIQD